MDYLFLLLIIPICWPIIAKRIFNNTISYKEMGIQILFTTIIVVIIFFAGRYSQTADTEIWNGQLTGKERTHGTYLKSYQCNCRTSCSGSGSSRSCSTTCQTCYKRHYTVTWSLYSSIGDYQVDHLDSTSSYVYNEPNPPLYVNAKKGEACSKTVSYTNYVQAVPQSLFHEDANLVYTYKDKIPHYPTVYNLYKINRVLNVGSKISLEERNLLNTKLNDSLRILGPKKQANIIVILTNIKDTSYRYAVENGWQGGEKNDIVIFLGLEGKQIIWSDVMTWALNRGNEMFHVEMRNGLLDIGTFDVDKLVPFIEKTILSKYDRPHMADFKVLEDEIDPPTWVLIMAFVVQILMSVGLTFYFHRNEVI